MGHEGLLQRRTEQLQRDSIDWVRIDVKKVMESPFDAVQRSDWCVIDGNDKGKFERALVWDLSSRCSR